MKFLLLLLTSLLFVTSCQTLERSSETRSSQVIEFGKPDLLGRSPHGDEVFSGGYSGLWYEGTNDKGEYEFLSHTDRGPNADPVDTNAEGKDERPFIFSDFQIPLVRILVDPKTNTATVSPRGILKWSGRAVTGRPYGKKKMPKEITTEQPVDLMRKPLPFDSKGLDPEGISKDEKGNYWMVEEYAPSIVKLNAKGEIQSRFIPRGTGKGGVSGKEALPAYFSQRKLNRGFEGVAVHGRKLYAFLQSPLPSKDKSRVIRILEFDTISEKTTGEYLYQLESTKADKIGDAVSLENGDILVVEQNSKTDEKAFRRIYRITLKGATNVLQKGEKFIPYEEDSEKKLGKGVKTVEKILVADLVELGFAGLSKIEGIAVVNRSLIAVINDNDFGLQGGFNPKDGSLTPNPKPEKTQMVLIPTEKPLY